MTPDIRGRIATIRQQLALPETSEEDKKVLVKEAITLVRAGRGKVASAVEAKRPVKRAAKKSGDDLLNEILDGETE